MSDTNTLDLSDLSSEPVESNVQAEISDAPADVEEPVANEEPEEVADESVATEEPEEVADESVATEEPIEAPVEAPVEAPSAPSTEEVVENVKEILSTEPVADNSTDLQERVKFLEERLEKLIEIISTKLNLAYQSRVRELL